MTITAPPRAPVEQPSPPARAPSVLRPLATAGLATGAAAWMIGSMFVGAGARLVAIAGVALGIGLAFASARTQRPAFVQYLVLPVSGLIGALLVLPETGPDESLQDLVLEAVRGGGLAQPPVPFDPGWRFLVVVVATVLAAAAASLALATKPTHAVALSLPVVLAAGVVQPPGAEVTSTAVALVLLLGAMAVASGEGLAGGAATEARFEVRRLGRGAIGLVLLALGVVALSRAGFLFPDAVAEQVIPAQRPPAAGAVTDRVLFTVEADTPGPWRLGVLDVYDGLGWLLPPIDPARMVDLDDTGEVPGSQPGSSTVTATFTIADLPGRVLPDLANPTSITGLAVDAQLDPRTQMIRLPSSSADDGTVYTVEAPGLPTGTELAEAGAPPAEIDEFLAAPQPPNEVVTLLAEAPENPWDRLVYARARFYERVIAAGAGDPVDVPPARAAEIIAGAEATPFEITATEALLARWAGVPARIGFGFFGGDTDEPGTFAVRPAHGATWLEVYFEGHGWIPIVGVPPRARASLSPEEQRADPNVRPTDELALIVHIPVRLQTVQTLVVAVRYWLAVTVPPALGVLLLWWASAGVLKLLRTRRRDRWARARGPAERIAVAYAQLRDAATDLGIGEQAATPLAFTDSLAPDDEHTELAWLVTRALWGDLARDLTAIDAEHAEHMARSVVRRLRRAQPAFLRVLAFGTRASLREPYTAAVPNLWPRWARERPIRRALGGMRRLLPMAVIVIMFTGACVRGPTIGVGEPGSLPHPAMPRAIGELRVQREPDAEIAFTRAGDSTLLADGRIYTLRRGSTVEGYVQIASFVSGVDATDVRTRDELLRSIAAGRFRLERIGDERAWVQQLPEQKMFLAFTPTGDAMTLVVARNAFDEAEDAFVQIVRHQRGETAAKARQEVPTYDPRTGESR